MKTGKLLLALCLLMVACTKQSPEPVPAPEAELRVSLSISRQDGFGTKASVKTDWVDGDVIFVFFRGVAFPKYLEMRFNGSGWSSTAKNGLNVSDLTDASQKMMTAVFLPYGNNAEVQSDGSFDTAYCGFFLQCEQAVYTYTDALYGSLNLIAPALQQGGKLIHLDVSGYTSGNSYTLYQEKIKPIICTGVSAEGTVLFEEGTAGGAIPGFESGSFLSFSGILDASAVGTAAGYQFSVNDADAGVLYTRDAGTKTVAGSIAIGLGDISSPEKWNANGYVDLGITQAGKRVLWATKNLGAATEADDGLYFAFGETAGYSAGSGHDFSADPVYEVENGLLTPEYDAAHTAWKGLWRLPTPEEMTLLKDGTTHEFADGGMNLSANGKSIFLPASGHFSATTLHQHGTYGCYWTSKEYLDAKAFFLGFGTADVYAPDATYTCDGQPIRPVFSIPQ